MGVGRSPTEVLMELAGKVCVVTGAAGGIGFAMAARFAEEGAAGVVVCDLHHARTEDAAARLPFGRAVAVAGDVGDPATHARVVETAEARFGPIDLYCSNAGIGGVGIDDDVDQWDAVWRVNTLAHVLAARAVLPSMLDRGDGYLLNTASAAGLLINLGEPAYTATKHAAVGLAEWLSATYRHRGIKVSCLCPMGVDTDMLRRGAGTTSGDVVTMAGNVLSPDVVAGHVVDALREERFLVLPHPEVSDFRRRKADDPDGWLAAMNRVQQKLEARS
jgi:NAD(P)-dependent dehydrogenase (short-subunit alcohol dehydrogenase family)